MVWGLIWALVLISMQRKIAGRCIILCTAEESFNKVPSHDQVEAADHFFRRAYDPANEEVVGLDVVEDAIGGTNDLSPVSQAPSFHLNFRVLGFRVWGLDTN